MSDDFTLDPLTWLTRQIKHAQAEGRAADALVLSVAHDALELNGALLSAIRAHRFDTAHLVDKLASKGYGPRLADQMLYAAAGLDRVPEREGE